MLDAQDASGVTPMMIAVKKENQNALKYLISKSANMKIVDNKKNNVFHLAATASKEIIEERRRQFYNK